MVQKYTKDRRKIAVVLLAAAVIVAVGGISSYAAKYVHRETDEQSAVSEEFYFTSDLLTSEGKKTYDLPVGTENIMFELRNYADDLRSAKDSISYTYTVAKGDSTVKEGGGTIAAGDKKSSTVAVDGLAAGTYTVVATSTSPYKETLSATFKIAAADDALKASVTDKAGSEYATLTVSAKEYEGDVTVKWPSGVIPDQTQDEFKDAPGGGGGSITKTVDKYSSYTFRFFKTDTSKDYSMAGSISASKQ